MNIKEANQIICEFLDDNSCMCSVNRMCPSPSSHHDGCLNKDCGKKITHTSYHPYSRSLDSLMIAVKKLSEQQEISLLANIKSQSTLVSLNLENKTLNQVEVGQNIQEVYCLAVAKVIEKIKENY